MTVLRKQEAMVEVSAAWIEKIGALIGDLATEARADGTPESVVALAEQLFRLADEGPTGVTDEETPEPETAEDVEDIADKIYLTRKNGKQKTIVGSGVKKMNFRVDLVGPEAAAAKKEAPGPPAHLRLGSDTYFPPTPKELARRQVEYEKIARGETAVAKREAGQKALAAALGQMFEVRPSS